MEYKQYRVKILQSWYDETENEVQSEEYETIVDIPKNVENIDGFLKYFLGVTKQKDIREDIVSYEEIEES